MHISHKVHVHILHVKSNEITSFRLCIHIFNGRGSLIIRMQKKASKQTDIQKLEKNSVPSAATEHGLSRHTAQKSISSEDVVDDCNPNSLQLIQINLSPILNLCTFFTFSQQLTTKYS